MGRLAVRQAIQTYLTNANIPYVGVVHQARTYINETDYDQHMNGTVVTSPAGSGCVLVVNLVDDVRNRQAMIGRGNVNDANVHRVALEVFFANRAADPEQAQLDYDAIIDAIFVSLRKDPTEGNQLWSAGEFAPGIQHSQTSPYTDADGMTTFINGVIRFEAWEWLSGQGI